MEERIVGCLRAASGHLTRAELLRQLGLPNGRATSDYNVAEQKLVDTKQIVRRPGRRGGIYLIDPPSEPESRASETMTEPIAADEPRLERGFYEPALQEILENWTEQPGFKMVFGAITAGQGRRQTGGRWTRPDLVLCTVSEWLFSSRPEGEVRTIEIKRFGALDVLAVYEAVAHKAKAHYSYLMIVDYPDQLNDDQKADLEGIFTAASKHGIGVITARNVSDWSTWIFEVDPTRSDADSQAINQFLLDQVPPDVREKFRKALTRIVVEVSM